MICVFAVYLRNITLRPSLIKDWFFLDMSMPYFVNYAEKAFNKRIEDDMSVDLLSQFSEVLRKKYKISINDDVIDQLN